MAPEVAAGFAWSRGAVGRRLTSSALAPHASHLFTTRDLAFRDDSAADYGRLAEDLGAAADRILRVRQVHGRVVAVAAAGGPLPSSNVGADAIVSFEPGTVASVRVADCVPILLADRAGRVVAAVHAGWRGTCAGITPATVEAIADAGVPPSDLVAAIGPSIGPCCYQVDDRVRTTFLGMTPDAVEWFAEDGPGHWRLDLWQANAEQLEYAGVPAGGIHVVRWCTADQPDTCFSYRREGTGAGRLVAAIKLGPIRT